MRDNRRFGFTGTRQGMSQPQLARLRALLDNAQFGLGYEVLHHGDCVGADAEADELAKLIGYRTVCHPPIDPKHRAMTGGHAWVHDPLPYMERNRKIVDVVEVLLAVPFEDAEVLRSGTWATVRYARRVRRTTVIIRPSGVIVVEDNK